MNIIHGNTHRQIISYHPEVGFTFTPDIVARIPHERGGFLLKTNSQGFRSDFEFTREKPAGVHHRVQFFGDSFCAGDSCFNHERASDIVNSWPGFQAMNFGVNGTGTDQQFLIRDRIARAYECDSLVLMFGVVDITRNMDRERVSTEGGTGKPIAVPKPYFEWSGGELVLKNVPVPRVRMAPAGRQGTEGPDYAAGIRKLVREYAPGLRPALSRVAGFQPHPGYDSEEHEQWRLMKAIIEKLIVSANGKPVFLLPLPDYYHIEYGLHGNFRERFRPFHNPGKGVYFVDVLADFLALPKNSRRKCRWDVDAHYSPSGHEVAAEALRKAYTEAGILKAASVPRRSPRPKPPEGKYILGVSCFYHDSAAALLKDGDLVAAAQEERFTRVKHDSRLPVNAINYCLEEAGIEPEDLQCAAYYDNPALTFERILMGYLEASPEGARYWTDKIPNWLDGKLDMSRMLRQALKHPVKVLKCYHHRSHAASAFFPSPFEQAAILTMDGVGEWATTSIGHGDGDQLKLLKELHFPHSLGILYSAFTWFTGFKVNSGEYKLMGLAPYGEPIYRDIILDKVVDLREDGSVRLNMEYFTFLREPRMANEKFGQLFGGPERKRETPITQREMDIAASIQAVTEEAVMRMARHAKKLTGSDYLCLAGGVSLNCVANGKLLRSGEFKDVWIQPAAGDAGGAAGSALDVWHTYYRAERKLKSGAKYSQQMGSLLGPSYSNGEIEHFLNTWGYPYHKISGPGRAEKIAELLEQGKVIGHFHGRMEYGPRALGSRSILGDPRRDEMQTTLNVRIKFRESFRPFAPAVLENRAADYFELEHPSPYMLIVAPVRKERRNPMPDIPKTDMLARLKVRRSDIPAVTHLDYSARVQTVAPELHGKFHDMLKAFDNKTGCAVVANTSFNVRGEPIVCTPKDAYRNFMRTDMDVLVLEDCFLFKEEQPPWPEDKEWIRDFELD